ncbi:hypothetical protein HX823_25645 [Pseudomonas sp. P7759]|uniref:hypothetical protein n=1 Tax=Pseudomonas sp. P7759 TaxID=2738831 RepID=UPI0015A2F2B6|nr:hypothetical protein [Pseudomonas sp. P7759]NWC77465.1 hypothetical protein [Pseudomonas sp. P7759]
MQTLLLLDLDGTILDTPHYEAWRNVARRIEGQELSYGQYIACIAGRPRLEGASRLLALQKTVPSEAQSRSRLVCALATSKQREFMRLSEQADLFEDAWRLLLRIQVADQRVRFYTASKNAPRLFAAALRKSGVLCDQQIEVVCQQPDQSREALFHFLLGDFEPDGVTLIDDSPYSVDLASSMGIRACQVRRNELHPLASNPRCTILASLDELSIPLAAPREVVI